jgi:Sel1 repeat-containing protein
MANFDTPALLEAIEEFEKGNYTLAIEELNLLADAGNPRAQCYLALAYQFGLGVRMDGKRAKRLLLMVAQQNIREGHLSAVAYNNLATLYFAGVAGIKSDPEKGQMYLKRSRELGFEM